jgi:hypothetical protein
MKYVDIAVVYNGSNGDATKALYAKLEKIGPLGVVALNLFRALKASSRAKVYRGRGYRDAAYDKKAWSMDNLCRVLIADGEGLGIQFGWGFDAKAIGFEHVLYCDIPTGQMSFHGERRGDGPDYPGQWDGIAGAGPERICRWIELLLIAADAPAEEKQDA